MGSNSIITCDLAILGGGLAGGLIARALAERRPEIDLRVVEPEATLGGNHVWSFFDGDIAAEDRWLVEPLISHRWPAYDVDFPSHRRTLPQGYNSVESERFDEVVRGAIGDRIVEAGAEGASATHVALSDGRTIDAKGVIDARGPGDLATLETGWQKFVGQELRLAAPHDVERPVVMDASVTQHDGYRFVYLLPFSPDRIFVEDTYYSDGPALDRDLLRGRIAAYAKAKGWRVLGIEREEAGVLPVTIGGDFDAYWRSTGLGLAKAGMRAGLFHPTTGYSLPDAVRLASAIARAPDLSGSALATLTRDIAKQSWERRGFYRMLDAMMFRAGEPAQRYRILQRHYRLGNGLIGRFFAGASTPYDKARMLAGKPPVPFWRAVKIVMETRF